MPAISPLVVLFSTCALAIAEKPVTISTLLGDFTGLVRYPRAKDVPPVNVNEFMGIRYAVPPVGANRFRPAQMWTTPFPVGYNATYSRPACIQIPNNVGLPLAEDCLFLNIWTPATAKTGSNLPVLLYIHGGNFFRGSGAKFNGTYLAQHNAVVVTINYRLGPLGFLASQELAKENSNWPSTGGANGIHDQKVAISFVKKFIRAFGGDSDDITIFGESAGALSTCNLLVAQFTDKLFQRAIVQSGACVGPWKPANSTVGLGLSSYTMKLAGINSIAQLRAMDPMNLTRALITPLGGTWFVSADNFFIKDIPEVVFQERIASNTPLNAQQVIFGFNSQDGLASWPYYGVFQPKNLSDLETYLGKHMASKDVQTLLNTYYPLSDFQNDLLTSWYAMNSDLCLGCPSFRLAELTQAAKSTAYLYEFKGTGPPYQAVHGAELPFVWGVPEGAPYFRMNYSELTSFMFMDSWTNFARSGRPGFKPCFGCKSFLSWAPYENDESAVVFSEKGTAVSSFKYNFRRGACPFWFAQTTADGRASLCTNF